MNEEVFDVVNERDEVVGQAPRKEVHARGLWHRAIHVLVFNARGEVFLQKRSQLKDTAKGKWDSSSSGHLDSGEAYDLAAVREVREEIGLTLSQTPERLFKIAAGEETGWEFCWVYRCASEGPFVLHPDEIETGGWFSPEAVTKWVNEKPGDFARCFVLIWKMFLAQRRNDRLAAG
jgi:isopentenyldiphosphate isomerase